jgi:Domain of unknown function (DUF6265)
MKKKSLVLASLIIFSLLSFTYASTKKAKAVFKIEDYDWIAGHWTGDGFGGTSEELWSPPQNGVMMGVYRHHDKDGKLVFYEFLTIDSTGMKLKHFNADMTAWETKEDMVHFELIEALPNKLVMKGLVMELKSKNEMDISLRMNRSGKIETEVFHMKRVKP